MLRHVRGTTRRDGRSAIPSLKHVLQVIQSSLTKDQGRRVTDEDARAYLQQVADSTGIIVLHPAPGDPEFGSVTFMHYSFAEYYAAIGLDASGVTFDEVAKLAQYHRWRETITLYAGLTMVTNVPFYSFKDVSFKRSVPFIVIVAIALFIALINLHVPGMLFLLFVAYGLSGYAVFVYRRMKGQPVSVIATSTDEPDEKGLHH